jgi:LysR family glycine cleavage system transcriptional activator
MTLIREWVTPMMSPELARDLPDHHRIFRGAQLLSSRTIVAFLKPAIDWAAWFRAANLPPRFSAGERGSARRTTLIDAATGRRRCGAGADHRLQNATCAKGVW